MGTDANDNESSTTGERKIKELEQEKMLFEETNAILNKKTQKLTSKNTDLEKTFCRI